jgi:DNA-binding NtrC family response regulator
VIPILVPPLRERREDIPLLAMHFAQRAAEQAGRQVRGFTPDALAWLQSREWAGNVRELQHAVERAVILCTDEDIPAMAFDTRRHSLTPGTASAPLKPDTAHADDVVLRSFSLVDAEKVLIERALKATGGNRTQAAKLLGISVRTLRGKLNSE